jgi:hypothetical protein
MANDSIKLVFADEVGDKILGFTVRGDNNCSIICKTIEQLQEVGATAWANSVELLIWLSRTPEFWGEAATSARFLVWDQNAKLAREVTVPRKGCERPFDRWDLI